MLRSLTLVALLACLPVLADAQASNPASSGKAPVPAPLPASAPATGQAPAPAAPPTPPPSPPVDWKPALGAVANIEVISAGQKVLRRTHGISLGDPPVLLTRYSDLAGGAKIVATFRGGKKVSSTSLTAADSVNNLAVLKTSGSLPEPPQPAGYIRWWFAKAYVIPAPAQGDTAILATVDDALQLDKMRVIPISGSVESGLPVMDVQGKWIGISGRIEDATGAFSYVTGSEDVVPVLFGPQTERPLSTIPASFVWCPPQEARGLLVRAVLRGHDKPDEAGPFFDLALKKDATIPEAHYWQGVIAFRRQSFADAESSFVRAGRLRSNWLLPWHMAGAAANQQGHYDDALAHYDRALKIDPKSAMTLGNQAGAYYNLHKISESIQSLELAISSDSTYAPAYQMLGAIYLDQGKKEDADRMYQKLLTLDTRQAQSLLDLMNLKR